jgi:hypothetical protein
MPVREPWEGTGFWSGPVPSITQRRGMDDRDRGPERNDWAFATMMICVALILTLACLGFNDRGPWQ